MYRNDIIPYGDPDERMSTTELSTKIDFSKDSLRLAVMYQPFRLNQEYTYVNYVSPGSGYLGTSYEKETGVTGQSDALGYSAKLTLKKLPVADDVLLQYTYLGLVAGDKNEINAQITEKITKSITGCIDYTYRKAACRACASCAGGNTGKPWPGSSSTTR